MRVSFPISRAAERDLRAATAPMAYRMAARRNGIDEREGNAMLHVSDILIERYDLESFAQLVDAVGTRARGERFLRIDVKPPFADTPENWEDVLESAFTSASGR